MRLNYEDGEKSFPIEFDLSYLEISGWGKENEKEKSFCFICLITLS